MNRYSKARFYNEYCIWIDAKQRCSNPNHKKFPDYGGRGITMSPAWVKSFDTFMDDMGRRPPGKVGGRPKYSLDRIDNDGPYSADNCRWANTVVQRRNSRQVRELTRPSDGKTMLLTDWANHLGIRACTLHERLTKWSLEDALSTPKLR